MRCRSESGREVPEEHRDCEEGDGEENCKFVDDLLRSAPLHIDGSAAAECRRQARDPVLDEDAKAQENRDDGFESEEEAGHDGGRVREKIRVSNDESSLKQNSPERIGTFSNKTTLK